MEDVDLELIGLLLDPANEEGEEECLLSLLDEEGQERGAEA